MSLFKIGAEKAIILVCSLTKLHCPTNREACVIVKAGKSLTNLPTTSGSTPFAKFLPEMQVTLVKCTGFVYHRLRITSDCTHKFKSWYCPTEWLVVYLLKLYIFINYPLLLQQTYAVSRGTLVHAMLQLITA